MYNFPQIALNDRRDKLKFVKAAAKHFESNPTHSTYGDLKPGTWFGIRWGMHSDCILVLKIDEDEPIENYVQVIDKASSKRYTEKLFEFKRRFNDE